MVCPQYHRNHQLFLDLARRQPRDRAVPPLKLKSASPLDDDANLSQIDNVNVQDCWESHLLTLFFAGIPLHLLNRCRNQNSTSSPGGSPLDQMYTTRTSRVKGRGHSSVTKYLSLVRSGDIHIFYICLISYYTQITSVGIVLGPPKTL